MRARTFAAISVAAALGWGMAVVGPAVSASAKNPPNLKGLSSELNKAKHLTYYAQYKEVSSGQTTTITIAQLPPKTLFTTSDGSSVINNGKATYYCTANSGNTGTTGNTGSGNTGSGNTGSGNTGNSGNTVNTTTTTAKSKSTEQCYSEKGANPLLGTEDLFSGAALTTGIFAEAEESAVARVLGIKVSTSSGNYAGVSVSCVTITKKGQGYKYCVTPQGILAYSSTGRSDYFELTKYSSHPPSNLFQLPAGATTVTIPSTP
jgi:hypothetical protein